MIEKLRSEGQVKDDIRLLELDVCQTCTSAALFLPQLYGDFRDVTEVIRASGLFVARVTVCGTPQPASGATASRRIDGVVMQQVNQSGCLIL